MPNLDCSAWKQQCQQESACVHVCVGLFVCNVFEDILIIALSTNRAQSNCHSKAMKWVSPCGRHTTPPFHTATDKTFSCENFLAIGKQFENNEQTFDKTFASFRNKIEPIVAVKHRLTQVKQKNIHRTIFYGENLIICTHTRAHTHTLTHANDVFDLPFPSAWIFLQSLSERMQFICIQSKVSIGTAIVN